MPEPAPHPEQGSPRPGPGRLVSAVGRAAKAVGRRFQCSPGDLCRLAFEADPHPIWVVDDETGRVLAVNAAVVRRFGYPREALARFTLADLFPAEDLVALAAAPGGRPVACRHRTAAGALVPVEVTAHRVAAGRRAVRVVVGGDAPEAREAEAALRAHEELLRNVFAHIPVGVFWKDRGSIYLGANGEAARGFGLADPADVVGRTDYDLMADPDEAEATRQVDRAVMDYGLPVLNREESQTRAAGGRAVVLVSKVPLRDAAGQVVGVLGVQADVTDRKRLEDQLRQAQKMEAIGRLAGGIAHDFNNLLTIILGNAELLAADPPDPAARVALAGEVRDAAARAAALTRQLLTFSRRQPARPEPVDLNGVVEGVTGMLRRLLGERVAVRTALSPAPVVIRADKGQLEQVILNLAVNARDAMPGGGTLTIGTAGATGAAGRTARLTVSDTGVGMTEEVRARIFEPFFTTKGHGKGTGLGLATVYGIVEQAGGTIEVESAPGAGTTFRIGFPWSDAPPPASAAGTTRVIPAGPPPAAAPGTGAGRRVLLVEDEDGLRKLARFSLEGQGYTVVDAEDAETALTLLTPDTAVDLLVTDMIMPGMDGRDLAGHVRAARPGVGVVLMSGYVPDADRLDGVPGSVFLSKPYTPADLVRAAERALHRSHPVAAGDR